MTELAGNTLTLSDILSPVGIGVLASGAALLVSVALRPRLLWPLLIVANILGNGPKTLGYVFLDEFWTISILAGALVYLSVVRSPRPSLAGGRLVVFLVWMAYMFVEAWIGLARSSDFRVLRWVIFYATLGLLACVLYQRNSSFPFPSYQVTALIMCWSSIAYSLSWLAQGIWSEKQFGTFGRFATQDYLWAGPAAAGFLTLLAVPASVFLWREGRLRMRLLSMTTVVFMLGVGYWFQARSLWVATGALVVFSWRGAVLKRFAATVAVVGFALVLAPASLKNAVLPFVNDVAAGAEAPISPVSSDERSRSLQIRAGWETALTDPRVLLFGAGVYSHRTLMIPKVRELLVQFPGFSDFVRMAGDTEIIRTLGFSALIIDGGMIGLLLYVWCLILVSRSLRQNDSRPLLVCAAIGSLLWLFVSNVTDMVLLYLLIAPGGLLECWSAADDRKTKAPLGAREGIGALSAERVHSAHNAD